MPSKIIKIVLTAVILVIIYPSLASAQTVDLPFALSGELGIDMAPRYPKPQELVSIELSLYTEDLNSADITWRQNGKLMLGGKGATSYSFKTGAAGEEINIEISIKLLSGSAFSKNIKLNPAGIDLIWEANSYVPPFYKGKALHPKQGSLRIVAIPEFVKNGRTTPPQNLIYKWSNGNTVYESQSGYGKNSIVVSSSLFGREENIEVLVTDPVNNLVVQEFLDVRAVEPEIVFYENNPYYGHIFESAVSDSLNLNSEEIEVLAAPYYFTKERDGVLKYEWRLNGQSIPNLSDSRTAIFRRPDGQGGKSNISLQIANNGRILQQAKADLSISFGN